MGKILMAMSGGVDSSVAAYLLKSDGHELIGAMMKFFSDENLVVKRPDRACCTLSDAEDARLVANSMGIPFYVMNFADAFSEEVLDKFVRVYEQGMTPNPCIDCNRYMKFRKFLNRAEELDCDYVATGHYARTEKTESGRVLLKTGLDSDKDQSYVLYAMTQTQLTRTLFPLGELQKDEVRKIAEAQNFVNAEKKDSQDICFAPDGDYAGFIRKRTGVPLKKGDFINRSGKVVGKHKGIVAYTVGQRKGLGLTAPEPVYVIGINAEENTVTVGAAEQLFSKSLSAYDLNLIPFDKIDGTMRVLVKIRYAHTPQLATIRQTESDRIHVEFDNPQRAITPGQAVVFYDGDIVLGGGTILPKA
ncbi:MAG: tRNA 2-thiouridine(34) synthase MnmA [Defluviitaleaceae bacterium]|nr:tRNA 2-thiouridine(34) synthase MnmA [Defluviitaleaceae bacterium]